MPNEEHVVPFVADAPDPTPAEDRVDANSRAAAQGDQRTVYMWTFSHTELPGRKQPLEFDRETFASAVVAAYEHTGKIVTQWAVFLEVHPSSKSAREQKPHFHMVVETDRHALEQQILNTGFKTNWKQFEK